MFSAVRESSSVVPTRSVNSVFAAFPVIALHSEHAEHAACAADRVVYGPVLQVAVRPLEYLLAYGSLYAGAGVGVIEDVIEGVAAEGVDFSASIVSL